MQHHPDKNPDDPLAHETFQRIAQAYETLMDPNDRATYDEFGPDGPQRGGGGMGGAGFTDDPYDLFEAMFGGMGFDSAAGGGSGSGGSFRFDPAGGGRGGQRRKPRRGRDTDVEYAISLEEAYSGKRVVMALERERVCKGCKGAGGRPGMKMTQCGKCEGNGVVFADRHLAAGLVGKIRITCPDCNGEGQHIRERDRCKKCKGAKVVKEKKRVEFHIEPGTEDGERIALQGEGDEEPEVPAGDVVFHIRIRPHTTFYPRSPAHPADLMTTVTIRLSDALLGFRRILFTHLDGRGIRIESKRGERVIRHGQEWVIRGEGMPIRRQGGQGGGDRGDLWVRFEVEMPGESWASRMVGEDGTTVKLPEGVPEMSPEPDVVVLRYLSPPR